MAFKFYNVGPSTIKLNSTKQGGQTVKCLVVFGRQTVLVWTGLNAKTCPPQASPLLSKAKRVL